MQSNALYLTGYLVGRPQGFLCAFLIPDWLLEFLQQIPVVSSASIPVLHSSPRGSFPIVQQVSTLWKSSKEMVTCKGEGGRG